MIVRPARPDDAPAIVAMTNPVIAETTITFTTEPRTEEGARQAIAERPGAFFVAEADGSVLGYATAFPFRSGPGYSGTREHTIVLAPQARGQGAGRALMTALEQSLAAEGIRVLVAGISGENPAGIAFHGALGFVEVGRMPGTGHKFGRALDLVLMQKMLGTSR